jgi:hypothetical protein
MHPTSEAQRESTKFQSIIKISPTLAPSPSNLAAHIQLQLALISSKEVILAHTRLVKASPTVSLAYKSFMS